MRDFGARDGRALAHVVEDYLAIDVAYRVRARNARFVKIDASHDLTQSLLRRGRLRTLVCGDGLVYRVELLVAVLDDRLDDVVLINDDGLKEYRGHFNLPVVDARGRVGLFAARERDRGLGRLSREQVHGLVDGHRLRARDDA